MPRAIWLSDFGQGSIFSPEYLLMPVKWQLPMLDFRLVFFLVWSCRVALVLPVEQGNQDKGIADV